MFARLTSLLDLELRRCCCDLTSTYFQTTATDRGVAEDTILRPNSLLNRLLEEEVRVDDGSFLPTGATHPWLVERWEA